MKVDLYLDLNSIHWKYNKDCLDGVDNCGLFATSCPTHLPVDSDRFKVTINLPDKYFTPNSNADAIVEAVELLSNTIKDNDKDLKQYIKDFPKKSIN